MGTKYFLEHFIYHHLWLSFGSVFRVHLILRWSGSYEGEARPRTLTKGLDAGKNSVKRFEKELVINNKSVQANDSACSDVSRLLRATVGWNPPPPLLYPSPYHGTKYCCFVMCFAVGYSLTIHMKQNNKESVIIHSFVLCFSALLFFFFLALLPRVSDM